jgi:hypothetical protein
VVLLEGLHWFDSGSEGIVEVLVDMAAATRTFLVVNFRPEYHGFPGAHARRKFRR